MTGLVTFGHGTGWVRHEVGIDDSYTVDSDSYRATVNLWVGAPCNAQIDEIVPFEDPEAAVPAAAEPELHLVRANERYVEQVTGENTEGIKQEIVGNRGSRYDLYVDKNTGQIYVVARGGVGEPQPTGLSIPR